MRSAPQPGEKGVRRTEKGPVRTAGMTPGIGIAAASRQAGRQAGGQEEGQ
jgi:hypothetical protein